LRIWIIFDMLLISTHVHNMQQAASRELYGLQGAP